jgi:hypothetical protein
LSATGCSLTAYAPIPVTNSSMQAPENNTENRLFHYPLKLGTLTGIAITCRSDSMIPLFKSVYEPEYQHIAAQQVARRFQLHFRSTRRSGWPAR